MSVLFQIVNKKVVPTEECLRISPFKEIWARDKTKKKEKAINEMSYAEFMVSKEKSNPYKGYKEDVRHDKLLKEVIKDIEWKPDILVKDAMKWIEDCMTTGSESYRYMMANIEALEKTIQFFTYDLDYNMVNKSGTPIYKPSEITRTIKDAAAVLASLNTLKKKVEEDLYQEIKNRNDREISPFAMRNSFE